MDIYSMIVNVNIMALLFSCCIMFMLKNPNKMTSHINKVVSFLDNIQKNNPTILEFEFEELNKEELNKEELENNSSSGQMVKLEPEKYENKYLKKYTDLANEYIFTEDETTLIDCEYERLKYNKILENNNKATILTERFEKINTIFLTCDSTMKITDAGIEMLLELVGLTEEYKYDPEDVDITGILLDLTVEMKHIENTLKNMVNEIVIDDTDELKQEALDFVVNKKLDNLINNYVLEYTPMGNIYMRYNNDKQSFEYFSNNSIPYRYLEVVGRKYVTTFHCKPIFIDLEEELKKADEKWESDYKKHEEHKKQELENELNNPIKQKKNIARLKNYNNNDGFKQTISNPAGKNRNQTNFVLPPQIKANLPDVNQKSNKQLLKDNANRYTWEGRLSSFNVLKKIDKKLNDKNLRMSFSDFKRMQQAQQNKK